MESPCFACVRCQASIGGRASAAATSQRATAVRSHARVRTTQCLPACGDSAGTGPRAHRDQPGCQWTGASVRSPLALLPHLGHSPPDLSNSFQTGSFWDWLPPWGLLFWVLVSTGIRRGERQFLLSVPSLLTGELGSPPWQSGAKEVAVLSGFKCSVSSCPHP